jgi:hypothetical protein
MKDRNGVKLSEGDWVLYFPAKIPFSEGHRICHIDKIGVDDRGEEVAQIVHNFFNYFLYSNRIEKLPHNKAKREQYVFLRILEMA